MTTPMTATHDTETCDAANGRPCALCEWASRVEQQHQPLTITPARLRQILLAVIDDGDPTTPKDSSGNYKWSPDWNIYSASEAMGNDARLRLCDELARRLSERQQRR